MMLFFPKLKGIFLGRTTLPTVKLMDLDIGLKVKIVPGAPSPSFHLEEVEVSLKSQACIYMQLRT